MIPQKIERIYAWIITEADGSQKIPHIFLGNIDRPLISFDKEEIESFRNYAHRMSSFENHLAHLVEFNNVEILETYIPDDSFLGGDS